MMCTMYSNYHFFVKIFHLFGKIIENSLEVLSTFNLINVHRKSTKLFKFVESDNLSPKLPT